MSRCNSCSGSSPTRTCSTVTAATISAQKATNTANAMPTRLAGRRQDRARRDADKEEVAALQIVEFARRARRRAAARRPGPATSMKRAPARRARARSARVSCFGSSWMADVEQRRRDHLHVERAVVVDARDLEIAAAQRLQVARIVRQVLQRDFAGEAGAGIADQIVGDGFRFRDRSGGAAAAR